jgi:hypothetical protein
MTYNTKPPKKEPEKIKSLGRTIGWVWKDGNGWACEHYPTGVGWDCIDTRQQAINALKDHGR